MYNHDPQHTGLTPYVGPDEPFVSWKYQVGVRIQSSPAIDSNGNIYFGAANYKLYALSPTGEKLWEFKTRRYVESSPAIGYDGTLYVGSWDSSLYAIKPDGSLKWEYPTDGYIARGPCLASDGTIYVTSEDRKLHAVNPDGSQKWTFLTGAIVNCSPALDRNEIIYFGSDDGYLYAVNPDGSQKWAVALGAPVRSSPSIDSNGIIYVGCNNHKLYALYPDGEIKWTFLAGNQIPASPSFDDSGNIYVGCHDTYLYSIRPDGTQRWAFKTDDLIWGSSPTIDAAGTIYIGSCDDVLYALNNDGSLKWKFRTDGDAGVSAVVAENGTIYLGSSDGYMYALGPQLPDDGGDLTVGWISRQPQMDYVWESEKPWEEGWPTVGEQVTWSAHIKSWSGINRKDVKYDWYLDGVKIASDSVDIPADSYVTVDVPWNWTFDRHELKIVLDPDDSIQEDEEENNSLLIYTDAISAGFYVEQSLYDYFREYQSELGVHSTCWENWIQRQVSRWNEMFENAVYNETPNGVLDRIRLEKITIVSDGTLPLAGGLPTNHPNMDDRSVDLQWGFPSSHLDSDFYKDHTTISDENAFYYEGSLIHELGHARYLIDTYGFNVHDDGSGNTVAIKEDGQLIVGTDYMPFIAHDAVHYTDQSGLMGGNYTEVDQYSAIALNLIAGHRATVGNYNAPHNIGVFLNRDLPTENRLTVKDEFGTIIPNAPLQIYQSTELSEVWYGKHYDDVPDIELTTDENGQVLLGRCPFDNDGTVEHGYGKANGTLIIRVESLGLVGYTFLEATKFNIEYWRGHHDIGEYEVQVSLHGIPVGVELSLFTVELNENTATLRWSTMSETNNIGFEIERSRDRKNFEKVVFIPGNGTITKTCHYTYEDCDLPGGVCYYRLKQIDTDGSCEYSQVLEVEVDFPQTFGLSQNYPNPFNPQTTIMFTVPKETWLTLKVFDQLGRESAVVLQEHVLPGEHKVSFDAANLASGIYFYELRAEDVVLRKKMIVLQ